MKYLLRSGTLEVVLKRFGKDEVILSESVQLREDEEVTDGRTEAPLVRVRRACTPMMQASSRKRPEGYIARMMCYHRGSVCGLRLHRVGGEN